MLLENKIDEMIELYNNRYSYQKIADKYNCSKSHVMKLLNGKVISRNNHEKGKTKECDENYFDCIDSEDKAYWLGFIFGDGFIYDEKPGEHSGILCISLSSKDEKHLYKFKDAISSSHTIHTYDNSNGYSNGKLSRIKINSNHMVNSLKKYGMIANKTNIIGEPKNINEEFYIPFVRGFFDADGSIMLWEDKGSMYWAVSFCKTPQLLNFIERILSYKWIWSQRKDSNNQCMTITLNNKIETVDFLNKLYANASIYLDRKYERYLEVINEL